MQTHHSLKKHQTNFSFRHTQQTPLHAKQGGGWGKGRKEVRKEVVVTPPATASFLPRFQSTIIKEKNPCRTREKRKKRTRCDHTRQQTAARAKIKSKLSPKRPQKSSCWFHPSPTLPVCRRRLSTAANNAIATAPSGSTPRLLLLKTNSQEAFPP